MDQKTIMDALQKALANGSGTLDDLEGLLKRAQEDVTKAKEEEKARKVVAAQKRGEEIAAIANRLLEEKPTDDDCAYMVNAWMKAHGYDGDKLTGKDLAEIFANQNAAAEKISKDLDKAIDELCNSVADWAKALGVEYDNNKKYDYKKKPESKKDPSADDVIDDFLKSFGLR